MVRRIKKNRKNQVSIYDLFKNEARRFCTETGLHGFKYIAMKGTNPTERFIWTFISFGALILALTLSTMSWLDSLEQPTMTATDSMQHPISEFLFPAVSICNLNKISKKKSIIFANEVLNVSNPSYWKNKLYLLAQLFFANYESIDSKYYDTLQDVLDKHNITAENALLQVTPNCIELLNNCIWKKRKFRCDRLFEEIRTPEGICCTFNHFALRNRKFEGYMSEKSKPYPKKVASCGPDSALKVLIQNDPNDYLVTELHAIGTKIVIHDSYNYPDWSSQRVLIPPLSEVYVDINPIMKYATEAVRAMSKERRGCVFRNERYLPLFSNYSYENCLTECRIHIVEKVCGCLPFYFRNEWANWIRPLRICNLRDVACISTNKPRFMSSVPGYDAYLTKKDSHKWGSEFSECDCQSDCETRNYLVHSTRTTLSKKPAVTNQQFYELTGDKMFQSAVSVFFRDLTATRRKKDVTLHWSQIFGLFGGLLGLCLGFTFVAVFEVIYTFTIRIILDYLIKKKSLTLVGSENDVIVKPFVVELKEQNYVLDRSHNVFLN